MKKDKKGYYQVTDRWIDAWSGGGPYVAGYTIYELRCYEDGGYKKHEVKNVYLHEAPEKAGWHKVFMIARNELGWKPLS